MSITAILSIPTTAKQSLEYRITAPVSGKPRVRLGENRIGETRLVYTNHGEFVRLRPYESAVDVWKMTT